MAAHRKTVALVVLACAWGAGIVLWVSLGHPLGQVLFNAAFNAAFLVVLWRLGTRRGRGNEARLDEQGGILVYLRYPDARPGSLSGIWNMGVVTFDEAGSMMFQPAVNDTLELVGRPTTFCRVAAVPAEPRKIDRKERKYVPYQVVDAIRLTTDKGDVEVAGKPESLQKLLGRVRQADATG